MKPAPIAALTGALLATPTLAHAPRAQERRAPNVLFLAIDDLNDWVGFLKGHPQVKTPNLDRLARRGTVFTNAHCQAPLCNPSRTSVLTGLRPTSTGIYGLSPWFRKVDRLSALETLPQFFTRNGYTTLACGKLFHDGMPSESEWSGGTFFWGYKNTPKKKFVEDADPNPLMDWGAWPERDEDHDDAKVADWAIGKLKAPPSGKPWFLGVGIRSPHVPCYAPQRWLDLYPESRLMFPPMLETDRDDIPEFAWYLHWLLPEPRLSWLKSAGQWKPLVRSYLASVSFMDFEVGRVLDALKQSGQEDNTVIVLWSDHGWHLGEKGITGKNTLWERSTHVPLVFAGPGIKPGQRCTRPAELLDLAPTLAELAGLSLKPEWEGHSLGPQLRDARAARPWPALTTHNPGNHTVRTEDWRYIRYADGSEELYDEKRDPNEWTNLAGRPQYAAQKAALAKWLPKNELPLAPGSASRILEKRPDGWYWEGKKIEPSQTVR